MLAYINALEMIFCSRARANEMADLTRNEKIRGKEGKGEETRIGTCSLRYGAVMILYIANKGVTVIPGFYSLPSCQMRDGG